MKQTGSSRRGGVSRLAVDDSATADRIVAFVQSDFPKVGLLVRAYDRSHVIALAQRGVETAVRETFVAALGMGEEALRIGGVSSAAAARLIAEVRERDALRPDRGREPG